MAVDMKLAGHRELIRLLEAAPRKAAKKAMRQAINAGATPIVRAARDAAPRESGTLRRAITKKVKSYRGGNAVAVVGARRGVAGTFAGKNRVASRYLHLVEKGTKPHAVGARAHPGAKANPLLQRALAGRIGEATDRVAAKLRQVLAKEMLKRGK